MTSYALSNFFIQQLEENTSKYFWIIMEFQMTLISVFTQFFLFTFFSKRVLFLLLKMSLKKQIHWGPTLESITNLRSYEGEFIILVENIPDKEGEDWLQQRSRAMGMQRQRVKVLWDRLLMLVKIKEQKSFEEKKKCFPMEMKREETNVCKTSAMVTWLPFWVMPGRAPFSAAGRPSGRWSWARLALC